MKLKPTRLEPHLIETEQLFASRLKYFGKGWEGECGGGGGGGGSGMRPENSMVNTPVPERLTHHLKQSLVP